MGSFVFQVAVRANDGDAVFIREFTLIRRDHLPEEPLHDVSQNPEDPVSARPEQHCTHALVLISNTTFKNPPFFSTSQLR